MMSKLFMATIVVASFDIMQRGSKVVTLNSMPVGQNIFTDIFPFYVTLKACGMFPMSFEGKRHEGNFKMSFIDGVLTGIMSAVMIYLTVCCVVKTVGDTGEFNIIVAGWKIT
jgi:hypothetical protein